MAVANSRGRPGTISSGCRTYGTIASSGWRVQALSPANAKEAAASCRKRRRSSPSPHSDAPPGNSRSRISWKAGSPDSSSRLRQNSRPREAARRARRAGSRASCAGDPGNPDRAGDPGRPAPMPCSWLIASLPVTGGARGQIARAPDTVLADQARPEGGLILGPPARIEHLGTRAHLLFGVTVARHAPLHLQGSRLSHQRHLIDATMAGGAADPLRDMDAVIEIG